MEGLTSLGLISNSKFIARLSYWMGAMAGLGGGMAGMAPSGSASAVEQRSAVMCSIAACLLKTPNKDVLPQTHSRNNNKNNNNNNIICIMPHNPSMLSQILNIQYRTNSRHLKTIKILLAWLSSVHNKNNKKLSYR